MLNQPIPEPRQASQHPLAAYFMAMTLIQQADWGNQPRVKRMALELLQQVEKSPALGNARLAQAIKTAADQISKTIM